MRLGGRVQGVGMRWFVHRCAGLHGVTGTVRNAADGTVEIHAEGDAVALTAFVEDVRRGPVSARVEPIEESWSEGPARYAGFSIVG